MTFIAGKKLRILVIAAALLWLSSVRVHSQEVPGRSVLISFQHYVDSALLALDSLEYRNALGQSYTISKLNYYLSNFYLHRSDGKEFSAATHFLISEEIPESKTRLLSGIPPGDYDSVRFLIGVDSLHNCRGAQSGDLDPALGMFWAWHTGYIFLKFEGKAKASTAPAHIFEYHIGGYRQPYNAIREIRLKLKHPLHIGKENGAALTLGLNASEILKNPHPVDFSSLPAVTEPKQSGSIADNYSDIFFIKEEQ